MNIKISGPAPSAERSYMNNVLTEVLRDVSTMDSARTALSIGGDALLGYPQFSGVDLKLEPPFLDRKATIPRLMAKLAQIPTISKILPKRLSRPTAIADYTQTKRTSGRIFCGASNGRFIGEAAGFMHLGMKMGSAGVCYEPTRNTVEGNIELCQLNSKKVGHSKHILLRKEAGQQYSGPHPLFQAIFGQGDNNKMEKGGIVSLLSDTQVEGLSCSAYPPPHKGQSTSTLAPNMALSLPSSSELSLVIREVVSDVPRILALMPRRDHWTFATPRPACQLSQLDDLTRSLHFQSPALSVSMQRSMFVTKRHVSNPSISGEASTLDRYIKIGRQILKTIAPLPNTSVLLGIESFTRFHYGGRRKLGSRLVPGVRAEAALTTAAYLSPSFMISGAGSIHASEAFDSQRIGNIFHSLLPKYLNKAIPLKTDIATENYTPSETLREDLQGFARVMSPISFSYVKNRLMDRERHAMHDDNNFSLGSTRKYSYTPIQDAFSCNDSSRLHLAPSTSSSYAGDGLLTRIHFTGIWRPPFYRRSPVLSSSYMLIGFEAAVLDESPSKLAKSIMAVGTRNLLCNAVKYATYAGVHLRSPIPITATVSILSNNTPTLKDRLFFGLSLVI